MEVLLRHEKGFTIKAVKEALNIDNEDAFLTYACDSAIRLMEPFVPMSNGYIVDGEYIPGGQLRENVLPPYREGDHYVIEYTQPYAEYQYYGVRLDGTHRVMNYTTLGTGPYWDKEMLTARGEEFYDELADYMEGKK